MKNSPIVRYLNQIDPVDCPYGNVRRVITGGEGSANVHVVSVLKGGTHFHKAYDEIYYVLSGTGRLTLENQTHMLRPGTIVNIPAGVTHDLESSDDTPLEFIIFGSPPMSIEDDRAKPITPRERKHNENN